jgi:hypothetical protein
LKIRVSLVRFRLWAPFLLKTCATATHLRDACIAQHPARVFTAYA